LRSVSATGYAAGVESMRAGASTYFYIVSEIVSGGAAHHCG